MKKIVIALLLFVIIVSGVFAQLTFGGEAYVGFQVEKLYDHGETVNANHRKSGHREEGPPLFNFTARAVRGDYGVKLDVDFNPLDPIKLNGIYGWADFLDSAIRLSIGKISDGKWVTGLDSRLSEYVFDKGITGFRVEYHTPLEGLSVGAAFDAGEFNKDAYNFEKFAKQIIFGASYVNLLFNTVFAYDLGSNTRSLFGFNFTGVDDLTAGLQMRVTNIATWESELVGGKLEIYEKVGYRIIRPLNVYVTFGQEFYGKPDTDMYLEFTPGVSYRFFPSLTGLLSVTLSSPDSFETTDLALKPVLEFSLGGTAVLYVEYELKMDNMKQDNHKFGFGIDIKAF